MEIVVVMIIVDCSDDCCCVLVCLGVLLFNKLLKFGKLCVVLSVLFGEF